MTEHHNNENDTDLRAEADLAENRFRDLVETSSDWIWEVDAEGRYTYCSPQVETILGYKPEELLGKTPFEYMTAEEAKRIRMVFAKLASDNKSIIRLDNVTTHKDGRSITLETCGTPVINNGKLTGYRGVDRDITERVLLNKRLQQADKMRVIGQLAGGIAHDFNNQLASILGYADMLYTDLEGDPNLREFAEGIIEAVNNASTLTNQLLAFGRQGKYRTVTVDLHRVILEVVSLLLHSLDKKITVRTRLNANLSITKGDPTQIQTAILDVVLYAKDSMVDGGEITIITDIVNFSGNNNTFGYSSIDAGSYLQISIADTGAGMDEETISHIYEPFYSSKEDGGRVGLGLAAVYGTIRSHGGGIRATSSPNEGTTFNICLPLHQEEELLESETKPVRQITAKSLRVLLVDDEEMVRTVASRMLRRLGCSVTTCSDGPEAIDYYRQNHKTTDLVILDMVMPVMNGGEVFQILKQIDPDTVVLLASGYSIEGDAQKVIENGACGFIQKPYGSAAFSRKIIAVLGDGALPQLKNGKFQTSGGASGYTISTNTGKPTT